MAATLFDALMANPNTTLVYGLALSAAIVLADVKTGVSLQLPGRRQLTLAGIIAVSVSFIYSISRFGVQGLLDQIAGDIIGFVLIGGLVLAFLFKRRNG